MSVFENFPPKKKSVPNDTVTSRRDHDDEDMHTLLEKCYKIIHDRRNSLKTVNTLPILKHLPFGVLVYRHLRRPIFDRMNERVTRLDHNVYDLIWPVVKKLPKTPDFRMRLEEDLYGGLFVPDQYSYKAFHELFDTFLKDLHFINLNSQLNSHPEMLFFHKSTGKPLILSEFEAENVANNLNLDPYEKNIISSKLSLTRNLKEYEFPKSMNMRHLELVELLILDKLFSSKMADILMPNTALNDVNEHGKYLDHLINLIDYMSLTIAQISNYTLYYRVWHLLYNARSP